jgi:hypothetical protein
MSSPTTNPTNLTGRAASWSIKLLDVGYIAVIYFTLGLLFAKIMDAFYGKFNFNKERKKSGVKSALETAGMIWLNGIVIYFVRNILSMLPFPLDGFYGVEHSQIKEIINSATFTYTFLSFQNHFKSKMSYIYRLMGPAPKPKPVLTSKQLAIIRDQIRQQVASQNIKDRATMKAVYNAAVSQALNQSLKQSRTNLAQRDQARQKQQQLQQQVLITRMQMQQAQEIARIRAEAEAKAASQPRL